MTETKRPLAPALRIVATTTGEPERKAALLRKVQRALEQVEQEIAGIEDPLLAHFVACSAMLAAERAAKYEERVIPLD